ncbi:hypothetical protein, partial [Gemmatimonas sp.]|uniref:hypothetical protein n=1 Tax=Gemmatimonas sp. TaxID=1962908 RepID=UPI0035659DBF
LIRSTIHGGRRRGIPAAANVMRLTITVMRPALRASIAGVSGVGTSQAVMQASRGPTSAPGGGA